MGDARDPLRRNRRTAQHTLAGSAVTTRCQRPVEELHGVAVVGPQQPRAETMSSKAPGVDPSPHVAKRRVDAPFAGNGAGVTASVRASTGTAPAPQTSAGDSVPRSTPGGGARPTVPGPTAVTKRRVSRPAVNVTRATRSITRTLQDVTRRRVVSISATSVAACNMPTRRLRLNAPAAMARIAPAMTAVKACAEDREGRIARTAVVPQRHVGARRQHILNPDISQGPHRPVAVSVRPCVRRPDLPRRTRTAHAGDAGPLGHESPSSVVVDRVQPASARTSVASPKEAVARVRNAPYGPPSSPAIAM